jgi:hypothetical protein
LPSLEKLLSERGLPELIGRAVSLLAWLVVERRLEKDARELRLVSGIEDAVDERRPLVGGIPIERGLAAVAVAEKLRSLGRIGAGTLKYEVVGFCTSLGLVLTLLRWLDDVLGTLFADSRLDCRCRLFA